LAIPFKEPLNKCRYFSDWKWWSMTWENVMNVGNGDEGDNTAEWEALAGPDPVVVEDGAVRS
jgi:hypothetical protein